MVDPGVMKFSSHKTNKGLALFDYRMHGHYRNEHPIPPEIGGASKSHRFFYKFHCSTGLPNLEDGTCDMLIT